MSWARWKVPIIIIAVIVIAGGTWASVRFWNYTQHDPAFCRTCHVMESAWTEWEHSAHAQVECHACHVQSIYENVEQLVKFVVLRPDTISGHAEVDYTRCGQCHLSEDPDWLQVAETPGHKVHFGEFGLECVGCHSDGVHRFVRPTDACVECHRDIVVEAKRMDQLHCTACHEFLATGGDLRAPSRQQCLECHAALELPVETSTGAEATFPHGGPMGFQCSQCHKPHTEAHPTSDDCRRCHTMRDRGLHELAAHAQCIACHRPHEWTVTGRTECEACHTTHDDHFAGMPCATCHSFRADAPAAPQG